MTVRSQCTLRFPGLFAYGLTLLLLNACAQQPQAPDLAGTDQRLRQLEGRIDSLERRDAIAPVFPYRSREQLQDHIRALESERDLLLLEKTPLHPDVREIDRKLRILHEQLEMLKQANAPN